MKVNSKDFEDIYEDLTPLWDDVIKEFFKSGERFPDVDINKIQRKIDQIIPLLNLLKKIKSV